MENENPGKITSLRKENREERGNKQILENMQRGSLETLGQQQGGDGGRDLSHMVF